MPSTYSHYYFGQFVYQQLPKDIQNLVDTYRDLYHVGQNGPDIFLYHAPFKGSQVSKLNSMIHHQTGRQFFDSIQDVSQNNAAYLAYTYGFICHFVLDAYCHPYIEQFKEETSISHMYIEMEFERYLLRKNGLNEFKYFLAQHIHITKELTEVISDFFPITTSQDIKLALFKMKMLHRITQASHDIKRKFTYYWMDKIGKPYLKDFVFTKYPNIVCDKSNQELDKLVNEAVLKAVDLIECYESTGTKDSLYDHIFG